MSQGFVLWFTGLSGSGKSTLTTRVAAELRRRGVHVETLDGDEVRKMLSRGLGFSREDRDANIRRIGFVAKLIARSGGCAIAAAISPYRGVRDEIRRSTERFCEVYCECPIDVLSERDPKGLYKKALAGEIKNFTGVDDPYEAPQAAEVHLHTDKESPEDSVEKILSRLEELGFIPAWGKMLAASGEVALIAPHGRDLVDRVLRGADAEAARDRARALPAVDLDAAGAVALENIACGRYSPLTGFMGQKDYLRVVREQRLESGLPWPLPILLPVADPAPIRGAREVALRRDGAPVALMEVHDVWEAEPGRTCAGGEIRCFGAAGSAPTPVETRDQIRTRGWRRAVAVATGEPPLLSDEYAARCALELSDGLLVQVRATPRDAVAADVRRACWEALVAGYFARDRVVVAPLPALADASMILDAIVARNHGATHILLPRDETAERIFDRYAEGELGIVPLVVGRAALSPRLGCFASARTAPDASAGATFDDVRAALDRGGDPPSGALRPEVLAVLQNAWSSAR